MAKGYISNRQKNLKVGIKSYTENNTVLEVTGKVGIGTTNAQYPLDVNGDINLTGTFRQNGSPFSPSRWSAGAGTTIYRNSFVGIGLTNPTQDLDVDGNVRVRGGLYDGLNNSSGLDNQVPVADGNGGWSWQPITAAGAGTLEGLTVRDEGSVVGTAGSITTFDFKGDSIVVSASVGGNIATITSTALGTPNFNSLNVTGISTLGFFEEDQKIIDRNVTLAPNTKYYSVHKNLILEGSSVLTIGAGSTLTLDRFNNLDDVKAESLTVKTDSFFGLSTSSTPLENSQMTFELTSDTNLRIKVRGSDGVVRSVNLTLS